MNIGKYFWSLVDFPSALQMSASLMPETPFYFKLKFSVENFK